MSRKNVTSIVVPQRTIAESLTEPVQRFLDHLDALGMSPATVNKRRGDLLCLLNFLSDREIGCLRDVTAQTLQDFITRLHDLNYSTHAIESDATSTRRFFAWLEDRAILFENPARDIKAGCHSGKRLGLVLTHRQIEHLLEQPNTTTVIGLRDRVILEVLYATGIRLGECEGISIFDPDLANATLKVKGKGKKGRLLPLGKHATKYLQLYLDHSRSKLIKRAHGSKDTHSLWLGRTGTPLGKQSIYKMIKNYSHDANLPAETDTHTLRRTCATHLLQGGAHPLMVSQLLGHSDLGTLSHYLKTTINDLMLAHARTNPGQ